MEKNILRELESQKFGYWRGINMKIILIGNISDLKALKN